MTINSRRSGSERGANNLPEMALRCRTRMMMLTNGSLMAQASVPCNRRSMRREVEQVAPTRSDEYQSEATMPESGSPSASVSTQDVQDNVPRQRRVRRSCRRYRRHPRRCLPAPDGVVTTHLPPRPPQECGFGSREATRRAGERSGSSGIARSIGGRRRNQRHQVASWSGPRSAEPGGRIPSHDLDAGAQTPAGLARGPATGRPQCRKASVLAAEFRAAEERMPERRGNAVSAETCPGPAMTLGRTSSRQGRPWEPRRRTSAKFWDCSAARGMDVASGRVRSALKF